MKKIISMLLAFSMVFSLASVSFATDMVTSAPILISPKPVAIAERGISVILNGEYVDFADENGNVVEPQLINDRTMVPMRKIFEVFGADVQWDGATETVTAVTEEKTLKLQINNPVAKVIALPSGEETEITLDSVPVVVDGRTLVPVRFIAESLELKVGWDGDTQTVVIIDPLKVFEIVKEKAPTFYEYITNEYVVPEAMTADADMILNIKYTNGNNKALNTNAKFVIDAMIKGAANLYEMNMDCKITGKGLMYEEIKAANMANISLDMILDTDTMVGYISSSLLKEDIGNKWLKVTEAAEEFEDVIANPQEYTMDDVIDMFFDSIVMTEDTYAALVEVVEVFCRFASDEFFTVSGRTTKTYTYEITLDELNSLLQELGMEVDLKDFAKSGKIKFSSKYANGINTSSEFEIAATIYNGKEEIAISFTGDSTLNTTKSVNIKLPAEKDIVEY
jgi:hypothetical protein